MRIFLDSCIVIYLVEGQTELRAAIRTAINQSPADDLCVNDLVRMECRIGPLRAQNQHILDRFDDFFQTVDLLPITSGIFDLAATLCATHGLKTPDGIHLATALYYNCGEFWTNDADLERMADRIPIRLLP